MYITSDQRAKLAQGLFDKMMAMRNKGETEIKRYEIEFQNVIETVFNGTEWWEVTDCQIFNHLLEHKDPEATVIAILKELKEDEDDD
jgi:hypothetical protein